MREVVEKILHEFRLDALKHYRGELDSEYFIRYAASEIEALLPKWNNVKVDQPKSTGYYYIVDPYSLFGYAFYNKTENKWYDSGLGGGREIRIFYWTTEEEMKKLLPKGE